MVYWLVKTEPNSYSFGDLQRDGSTTWDGVRNAQALIHIRAMRPGDRVLIYHSGDERAVVGSGEITSEPYADPQAGDPKLAVVDIRAGAAAERAVSLATIKADPMFAEMGLVRMSRLSVMPV